MVCVACNGKGYVIEKHRELVCSECQGRGECFFSDRDKEIISRKPSKFMKPANS